jgi:hypothetical protein
MQNKMSQKTSSGPNATEKALPNAPSTSQQCKYDPHTTRIHDQFSQTETRDKNPGQTAAGSSFHQMSKVEPSRVVTTRNPGEHPDSDGDTSKPSGLSSATRLDKFDEKDNNAENIHVKLRETEKQLDDAVAALASLHSTDPFRVGDDRIARARDELYHDIRNWSKNFRVIPKKFAIGKIVKDAVLGTQDDCPFLEITPSYDRYLELETGLFLLVQSYVWKILMEEVFDCFVWTGGLCRRAPVGTGRNCPIHQSFDRLCQVFYASESYHPTFILL